MSTIAQRAGLTKVTLYRHFASKDELMCAIMAAHFDELTRVVEEIEQTALAPRLGIETYAQRALERLAPDSRYFQVALSAGAESDELRESAGRLDSAVARLLTRAQEEGTMRADLVAGDIHSLIVAAASGTVPSRDHGFSRRYLALALDGLGPTTAETDEPPMRFEDYGAFQAELARRRAARAGR
jgi:AcrR family transcriptional regulator